METNNPFNKSSRPYFIPLLEKSLRRTMELSGQCAREAGTLVRLKRFVRLPLPLRRMGHHTSCVECARLRPWTCLSASQTLTWLEDANGITHSDHARALNRDILPKVDAPL